jgi:hypothetical protein
MMQNTTFMQSMLYTPCSMLKSYGWKAGKCPEAVRVHR